MAVNDAQLLQTSALHSWVGYAAADKAANSISLEVMIPEMTPSVTGTLTNTTSSQAVQLQDINGNTVNSSVTTGNTVTADYMGGSSNRKYPPDVVKGEQVKVTKFANADKYYWESMGRDDTKRMNETYRVDAANRSSFSAPLDDSNTYSMEIDTKRAKHIRLKTSNGTGESFTYQLILDGANSQAQLTDDQGNSVLINSSSQQIIIRNNKQAFIMLNGEDIIVGAPRDITFKAGRQMLIDSPLITVNATSGTGVLAVTTNAIAMTAKNSLVLTAPAIGLVGAVQVPMILTALNIRAETYANGSPSATYGAASIGLAAAAGVVPTTSPDTSMPSNDRHSAAYEQVSQAFAQAAAYFAEINAKIGVPSSTDAMTNASTASIMNNLQGT